MTSFLRELEVLCCVSMHTSIIGPSFDSVEDPLEYSTEKPGA